jgi:hypothetical protein
MAATSTGSPRREVDLNSYYTSSEDEERDEGEGEMEGGESELDTRRLLQRGGGGHYATPVPVSSSAAVASLYPQLQALGAAQDPQTAPPVPTANGHITQYGSVSSSVPSNERNKAKWKRYRLPFLILLVFDCGLVIFLSIISYDSKKNNNDPIPKPSYFDMDLRSNYFDLVLLAMLRLFLNALLYIVLAWVTRAVMGVTTIVSAVYVPLKAYYSWPLTSSDNSDFQDIPILLILFVSFVIPWAEAFFFEFKVSFDHSLF